MTEKFQLKFESLAQAAPEAIRLSKEQGYSCIVLSNGVYYVEIDAPFTRAWEELIGEYEKGELIS